MKRVAVVSGGADGIGKETVLEMLDAGYSVAALDIDDEKLRRISKELENESFIAVSCNAADEASVASGFEKALQQYGRIDVLVNIAGGSLGVSQPVDRIETESWDRVIELNLKSVFLCTREAVKIMRKQQDRKSVV